MGTPKIKKSVDTLTNEEFRVQFEASTLNLLLSGKTPKYEERFKAWARNTQGEHLNNLTDALLSAIAYATITRKDDVDYLRGQAQGVIIMHEWIKQFGSETGKVEEEEEDVFNGL